jgi:hypothetical protein
MAGPNTISIDVLRRTINGVFDFIEREQRGVAEVELKQTYYWSITDDVLYSMDEPPKQLAVGSLADDYEFVLSSFKNADQQLPILFMHIAPLLQALWQAVPNYASPREADTDMKGSGFSHLIEIDESARLVRIHRIFPDGSKHLFTERSLPPSTADSQYGEFARLLGENILLDSPAARRAIG